MPGQQQLGRRIARPRIDSRDHFGRLAASRAFVTIKPCAGRGLRRDPRDGGRGPPLAGRRSRRSSLWAFEATAGGVDGFVGVVECGRDRLLVGECGPGGLGAAPCV